MKLIKEHWKELLIGLLAVFVVLLMVRSCGRKPPSPSLIVADSVIRENANLVKHMKQFNDSINAVVKEKDETNIVLNKELQHITAKYIAIRNSHPSKDTVVKNTVVYQGAECCEKLPVVERQRDNAISEIGTLKAQVSENDFAGKVLQKEVNSLLADNAKKDKENKKLNRRRKWNKVWAVAATITTIGALTAVAVIK